MINSLLQKFGLRSYPPDLVEQYGIDEVKDVPNEVWRSPEHDPNDYLKLRSIYGAHAVRVNPQELSEQGILRPYSIDPSSIDTSIPTNQKKDRFSVNYVWITSPSKDDVNKEPRHLSHWELNNMLKNAAKYEDADFQLWLDFEAEDNQTIADIQTIIDANEIKNLAVRNLRDIPQYNDVTATNPNRWTHVDIARMIVVDHELGQDTHDFVIYSDFDVSNVDIDMPSVKSWLTKIGFVPGCSIANEGHDIQVENSYFGVSQDVRGKFSELTAALSENAKSNKSIWSDYFTNVGDILPPNVSETCGVMWHCSGKIVPPMHWQPEHPSHKVQDLKEFEMSLEA